MSILDNVEQTEFDSFVKLASQSAGVLSTDVCQARQIKGASSETFRKAGDFTAVELGYGHTLVGQDPDYTQLEIKGKKWGVPSTIDDTEQFRTNINVRQENGRLSGMAIGRRKDQIKLAALQASGTTHTIAEGGTGFTFKKLNEIIQIFDENNIPEQDRHLALSPRGKTDLLQITALTSSDFVTRKSVTDGRIEFSNPLGLNLHVIGNMKEGGLIKVGDTRTCLAWSKTTLGYVYDSEMQLKISYVAEKDSDLILAKIFAQAGVIDANEVINIEIDEAV